MLLACEGVPTFIVSQPSCGPGPCPDRSGCAYQIAWSINPHMEIGSTDSARAMRQHASFVRALRRAGAELTVVPFVHGAYDCVFAKDNAVLLDRSGERRALLASPRHEVRRAEQDARRRDLEQSGFRVDAALDTPLEGGDVALIAGGSAALMGHGFRTDLDSARGLARFIDGWVVPLELRDPMLYHLDMALLVLADGTLVFAEEAFTSAALKALARLPFRAFHPISKADALRFGLNVVEVGNKIVTGTSTPTMDALWSKLGRKVESVPLGEFQRAGGSAACLVAQVHEEASSAALGTAA